MGSGVCRAPVWLGCCSWGQAAAATRRVALGSLGAAPWLCWHHWLWPGSVLLVRSGGGVVVR